jgi:hypothetical protein
MLPECARDSFKDVKHNITECVAILEEPIKVVGDMNMKPVRRPPAFKRRNTLIKEPKHKTGVSGTSCYMSTTVITRLLIQYV